MTSQCRSERVAPRWRLLVTLTTSVSACAMLVSQAPPVPQPPARVFEEAVTLVERNDCAAAIPLFERVSGSGERSLAARALVYLGDCFARLGNERARSAYRRVLDQFPEQRAAVAQARARLATLERATAVQRSLVLRRLWDERPPPDLDWAGPPSRDGRLIPMFDEARRLVIMDIGLKRRGTAVAVGHASDGLPACTIWNDVVLAPGAREVAFSCETPGGYELRVARLDGARPQQRRVVPGSFEPLAWVPPDTLLAQVIAGDGRPELTLVGLRDGRTRVLIRLEGPANPSMSADRRTIAYDAPQDVTTLRRDVVLMPLDGGTPSRIGWPASDDHLPAWTADGRGLVFVSDRTGSPSLWLQAVRDARPVGAPRVLTQDLGRIAGAWGLTTAGSFLYFRQTGLVDVYVLDLDERGMPAGTPRPASSTIGAHMWSAWSPDGHRLAAGGAPPSSRVQGVTIFDVVRRDERLLPSAMGGVQHLRWSPDGARLALRGRDRSGRYGFFTIDVASGAVETLRVVDRNNETELGSCTWDADGRGLLFHESGRFRRIDVHSREERPLTFAEDVTVAGPFDVLRPDGSLVFLRTHPDQPPAVTIAKPDGTLTELFRPPNDEQIGPPTWMPDGRSVLITRRKTDRNLSREARWPALWRIDVESKALEPLRLTMDGLRDVWVSPDGQRLAFTAGSPSLEPWVVENFLPAVPPRVTR